MPVFNLYSNGFTCGVPPTTNNHSRAIRGEVKGWSEASTRSNTKFLYSVDADNLTGHGYALTFTLKELPPTPEKWHQLIHKLFKRLRKSYTLLRYHWVTEWQRRGVPHLHAIIYLAEQLTPTEIHNIKVAWCASAVSALPEGNKGLPLPTSQTVKPVTDALGWVQYLGKHGSRGLKHYQRASKPESWEKTGRMWSKGGHWPVRHAEGEIPFEQFHKLRRILKGLRIADARKPKRNFVHQGIDGSYWPFTDEDYKRHGLNYFNLPRDSKRIKSARNMLKCNNRKLSTVRGVSEWHSDSLMLNVLSATFVTPVTEQGGLGEAPRVRPQAHDPR